MTKMGVAEKNIGVERPVLLHRIAKFTNAGTGIENSRATATTRLDTKHITAVARRACVGTLYRAANLQKAN